MRLEVLHHELGMQVVPHWHGMSAWGGIAVRMYAAIVCRQQLAGLKQHLVAAQAAAWRGVACATVSWTLLLSSSHSLPPSHNEGSS